MEFRMLGPLEVAENGNTMELGGTKERTLLAVLLLHANETVPTERLVDELWGDEPPRSAPRLVSTYVWQLRKSLGEAIVTRAPGYAAVVPPDRLDVTRFEDLVRAAADQPPAEAARTLTDALALWRGRALEDVQVASLSGRDVERLEELRLTALAQRIDRDLELRRHEQLLSELRDLVARHPYNERFRAQLVLALYRSGRQADALDAYSEARETLHRELGVEPGPELRELQARVLRQDPTLRPPEPPGRRRRGPWLLLAGVAAVIAASAIGVLLLRSDEPATVIVGPNSVAAVDPRTAEVVAGVPVGIEPGSITSGVDGIWVANFADKTVGRIAAAATSVEQTMPVEGSPTALANSPGTLWALARFEETLTAVEREFGATVGRSLPSYDRPEPGGPPFGQGLPTGIASGGERGGVWIGREDGTLLDERGRTRAIVPYPVAGVAFAGDVVWVVGTHPRGIPSAETPGVVFGLDPSTGEIESETAVGRLPNGVAIGLGFVWVVNTGDGTLERLDPITGASLETIPLGTPPIGVGPQFSSRGVGVGGGLAIGEGSVWVTDGRRKGLIRYEPETGRVTRIPLDAAPADVAVGHGLVWVSLRETAGG